MRKLALLALLAAALAVPCVAAAATPQGKLTGSATIGGGLLEQITTPVIDGGTTFVGLENDNSGNCDGDTGAISENGFAAAVVCAHFVAHSGCCNTGSPKMRFAWLGLGGYVVVRITDNGAAGDTFGFTNASTLAQATAIVNKGVSGGHSANPWSFLGLTAGDYTITASQT